MVLVKEEANELLKEIRSSAKKKIKDAGGNYWTKIANSGGSVTLVIQVACIDKTNQTTLPEFTEE